MNRGSIFFILHVQSIPVNQYLLLLYQTFCLSFQEQSTLKLTWAVFSKGKLLAIKERFYSSLQLSSLPPAVNWLRFLNFSRHLYSQPCDYFYKGEKEAIGRNGWSPKKIFFLFWIFFLNCVSGGGKELGKCVQGALFPSIWVSMVPAIAAPAEQGPWEVDDKMWERLNV